jgi:pyruvate,water dikinase
VSATETATAAAPGTDEFPVSWPDPADEQLSWMRDRLHNPGQTSPLTFDVISHCFTEGAFRAMRAMSAPIADWLSRRINSYTYNSIVPVTGAPEEMAARGAAAEEYMTDAMGRVGKRWLDEFLPEIHEHLAVWEKFDLAGSSMDDLLEHLDDTLARFTRLCDVHMLAIVPAYVAISELDECYRDLFPDSGPFGGVRLVQGHMNKTVEVGHELWKLSRVALTSPEVVAAIGTTAERRASADVLAELDTTEAGRAFAAGLADYLEVYGQRGDVFFDLDRPAWIEDPTPAFDSLRSYMAQPDTADPAATVAQLAAERDQIVAETRERLAGYPAPVRGQFEFLLEAATIGVVISEDHGFWIDFRSAYKVRQVLVEFGRRLTAANEIGQPEDAFFLTLDELRESAVAVALGAPCRAAGDPARARVVERRRAEMERFAAVRPPDGLGAPPQPPPSDDPFSRTFGKFFGGPPPAPAEGEEGLVRGNPGGPGRVRGTARVIRSLAEADRLAPGEILVAETTSPPWTPLFAVAAAVVTDTGGVLSHCAVVAREYGLPAVVGTGRGTDRITDGMVIEVDGDQGVVFLNP